MQGLLLPQKFREFSAVLLRDIHGKYKISFSFGVRSVFNNIIRRCGEVLITNAHICDLENHPLQEMFLFLFFVRLFYYLLYSLSLFLQWIFFKFFQCRSPVIQWSLTFSLQIKQRIYRATYLRIYKTYIFALICLSLQQYPSILISTLLMHLFEPLIRFLNGSFA